MGNPAKGDKKNIVKLAYLYFQEGRWDSAIEEYRKLLELDPGDLNIHNMLGDVYVKKNAAAQAYEEYIKVAADLINHDQAEKATLIHKKISRLDRSQLSPAAQQKQSLIQLHLQADEALEQNKVDEAIMAFGEIMKLDPEDLVVASKLAGLEEKIGRIPDAVEQYTRLGESFLKNHLFKKAQEMFKKVETMDPQNVSAHVNLAQIYIKQGSESDAKKEYLTVADQALVRDDLDNAFEYAGKAVELKSIEAHYIVGVVLFKRQKWAEAKLEFENLLRFKINHVGAQVYLGKVYAAMEQADKAVESFQKALKIDKDNIMALQAWADYCVAKKNKNEAIQTLALLTDKAISTNNLARAVELVRTMVSVDETIVSSKLKLAQVLQKSGDLDGAAEVYYQLAAMHGKQNKPEDSMLYLQKALELNPNHAQALAMAPEKMRSHGTPVEPSVRSAATVDGKPVVDAPLRESVDGSTKPQSEANPQEAFKAQLAVADQYVKQNLLDEAIDIYQQLLDVDPENSELKRKLNGVYAAYAKTGTDLTNVFAPTVKAPEEPKKITPEAAKKPSEADDKALKELEVKAKQEADKKIRSELEKKAREEADKRADEEIKRMAAEKELKSHEPPAPIKIAALPTIGGLDEMVETAQADLLNNEGLHEEAAKAYRTILEKHPHNEEVRKKLTAVEEILKPKEVAPPPKAPPLLKVVESPAPVSIPEPVVNSEKDSNIKKKSNKIGYV
jgi:tetratricopeptide (TPR) repeat protein